MVAYTCTYARVWCISKFVTVIHFYACRVLEYVAVDEGLAPRPPMMSLPTAECQGVVVSNFCCLRLLHVARGSNCIAGQIQYFGRSREEEGGGGESEVNGYLNNINLMCILL